MDFCPKNPLVGHFGEAKIPLIYKFLFDERATMFDDHQLDYPSLVISTIPIMGKTGTKLCSLPNK